MSKLRYGKKRLPCSSKQRTGIEVDCVYPKTLCECLSSRSFSYRDKAGEHLDRAPLSSKLYGQYAKAREASGQFLEAARAYERAKDYDNAARLTVIHTTVSFFL